MTTSEQPGLPSAIRESNKPTLVSKRIAEEALRMVPSADGCFVALVDGDALTFESGAGSFASAVGLRLGIDESLAGLALRTGSTFYCKDSELDAVADRSVARRFGAVSFICVPLCNHDQPLGTLVVASAERAAFNERDVLTLTNVAEFVAAVIDTTAEIELAARKLVATVTADEANDPGGISTFVANVLGLRTASNADTAEADTTHLNQARAYR